MMTEILGILIAALLSQNFILVKFYGICPFMGVSKKIDTALGMGMAVTFVMALASAACYAINLLLIALNLEYMQTVAFILVIATLVQVVEMFLKKFVPALYKALGVFLPLITTNCAVLGVVLVNVQNGYNFLLSVVNGAAGGLGFTLAIVLFASVRERVNKAESISYFRYYFCGAIFTVMYNIFVGILHAVGDSKHPLYYLIFSTFLNIALDLLFVAVLGFGVGSAAIATTVSQGVSALLCMIHLLRCDTPYRVRMGKICFHRDSLVEIIRYGLPSGVQNSVIALANVVVQTNINSFGAAAIAGCGSYSKMEGFTFLPVTCFSQALSTFVGQNLGAGQYKRVKKGVAFGVVCSCTMAEIIGVLSYLFAPQLIGFFSDSPEAIAYGTLHMRVICLFYFLLSFSHCIAGVMRGAGKATVPMFTMLACWCVIRVSYITVAMHFVNRLTTVSWAYPLTWTLSSIIFLIYFFKADWMYTFEKNLKKA